MLENGHRRNGKTNDRDISLILEDWIFLVREHGGILARATEHGLNVWDWTGRYGGIVPDSLLPDIKGKKVIVVMDEVGDRHHDEFEILGKVRADQPALLRVWKPFGLGDEKTPTLKELSKQYSLEELLWWEKPWENEPPPARPERRAGWPCTDMGNAERMANRYGSSIRFCRPWKKWLVWDGQRWIQDDLGRVNVMAKTTIRKIYEEAAGAFDTSDREKLAKWAIKCEASARIGGLLQLVWSEPRVPIIPAALDPDPWLFNCPNGTVELKTGTMRRHDRSDLITRMSPVEFDPIATCPLWEETIERVFAANVELIGFVRRLFGLALTGDVSEQILPIFFGEGGNGKSTILNTLLDIMGSDYAIVAPPGLLFAKHNEGHPTDKASLFGMRLVVDLESAEDARLNEALVKQLTGSDRISARRMREDFWTFLPTHKLILCTNNQPAVSETKSAIWRRLKLVPFAVEIPEAEQRTDLPKRLKAEYPGILAWAVRGCVEWVNHGLQTPKVIQDATAEYRAEEDALATFLNQECKRLEGARVKASTLYQRFVDQADRRGPNRMSRQAFGRAMKKKGFTKTLSNGKWYDDLVLLDDEPGEQHDNHSESY